jgi:hypothetical protein
MNSAKYVTYLRLALSAALGVMCLGRLVAEDSLEAIELKSNLQASANRVRDLQGRLEISDRQQQATSAALAGANDSVKEVTTRYENMRAALSGVGATSLLGGQNEETQQRLLSALADLKAAKGRINQLESAIGMAAEKLALPETSTSKVASELTAALAGQGGSLAVSVVAAIRPEQGLAIISLSPGVTARAGAKVLIGPEDSQAVSGIIVEARDGAACVSLEQGLGLTREIKVGAPVQFSVTSKL